MKKALYTLRKLFLPWRMESSVTDDAEYPAFCERASRDEEVFADFKRHPVYRQVLEHVTEEEGAAYLEKIASDYSHLLEHLPAFKGNDRYGNPHTYDYGEFGEFSPTTLRYVKVLGDLENLFGDLAGMDVVEIGGGYGGQCKIVNSYSGFGSYTIIDLEPSLRLAKTYLDKHGVAGVHYRSMDDLDDAGPFDLAISNYAFTECRRHVQELYLDEVLSASTRGYLTGNDITPPGFDSFSQDELLSQLPGAKVMPEDPATHIRSFVLVWGAD